MFDLRLERLKQQYPGYWSNRILYQIAYAHALSKTKGSHYDELINLAIAALDSRAQKEGAITIDNARQVEDSLAGLSEEAKRYRMICTAHAHIDMNWMWRWDETVSISLDTFRTMLALMKEYPDFKFSQSQASVYQIVETFAPEMLDEIRELVKQGRWEVTASTWVEADKNLPNGESQARHLLYTRRYLTQLFGLTPDQFHLDFEPDTFGHHANVPEILAGAGVKYYYHCRGDEDEQLYRWAAPSGRSILVYREPFWYLGSIEPEMALYAPAFCRKYEMDTMLKVYGAGDHGGGPTRRDIERIADMATWPVFPRIQFGTFEDYFSQVEKASDHLPVKTGELNMIFTGCYTSQSRIKRANRLAEANLNSAEAYASLAALNGASYPAQAFEKAWQNTLFNQFHDIIPGSGVIDTREYALGLFQQTMAIASSQKSLAFHALTRQADVTPVRDASSISEGAGVGYGVEEFKLAQVSRGSGKTRLFHIFNPAAWPRKQVVELVVWDWDGDLARLVVEDEDGKILRQQPVEKGFNDYWQHRYLRLLVELDTPACGYGTVVLKETNAILEDVAFPSDPRIERPEVHTLENELLRATFDSKNCALVSLFDKASGAELVSPVRPAVFRRIQEDDKVMGTAWVVGRYMDVVPLDSNVQVLKYDRSGVLRQSLTYFIPTGSSKITVTVSLDAGSRGLDYAVDADWHEIGRKGVGVPQLNFLLPLAYTCRAYRYDIPFGTIDRLSQPLDVPANSWAVGLSEDGKQPVVQLITEGNYGFRGVDDALALTMIRSSFDPDPYPEVGNHKINFRVEVAAGSASKQALIANAYNYTHPLDVFSGAGLASSRHSYLSLESGNVGVSAIKISEDNLERGLILRLYETEGEGTNVVFHFDRELIKAEWVDVHEQPAHGGDLVVEDNRLRLSIGAYQVTAVKVWLTQHPKES